MAIRPGSHPGAKSGASDLAARLKSYRELLKRIEFFREENPSRKANREKFGRAAYRGKEVLELGFASIASNPGLPTSYA